jgi:hypothetical protein
MVHCCLGCVRALPCAKSDASVLCTTRGLLRIPAHKTRYQWSHDPMRGLHARGGAAGPRGRGALFHLFDFIWGKAHLVVEASNFEVIVRGRAGPASSAAAGSVPWDVPPRPATRAEVRGVHSARTSEHLRAAGVEPKCDRWGQNQQRQPAISSTRFPRILKRSLARCPP